MPYFLGVDAGGTKTEFLLGDETKTLARVRTGTIKRMRANEAVTEANLLDGLAQLTTQSGVSMRSITRTCIGAAGETVPLVVDWYRQAFARYVGGELVIVGDVEIALDAAFCGQRGVLVLAGTGSNVAGRASTGKIVTAGGWGPAMADQGSGHVIGRDSLRRGFMAIDQQRPTRILEAAMKHWNLKEIGDLIERANGNPAPDFSQLAPLVVECAKQGDQVARELLEDGGRELAYLASLVIERIRGLEADSSASFTPPPVAVAGSILEHVDLVRNSLNNTLGQQFPGIKFVETPADPPAGALWGARNRIAC
jgi:N-acetylglucosamine kinase-like BadF-type ATPase